MPVSSITEEERRSVVALSRALEPFQALTTAGTPIPLSVIQMFLRVATRENQTVSDLARASGLPQSTITKLLQDLTWKNRSGGLGHGLVEQSADQRDGRLITSRLTTKGLGLVSRIAQAVQPRARLAA
jgi:DNA-binding MarR family transcriptional regulator